MPFENSYNLNKLDSKNNMPHDMLQLLQSLTQSHSIFAHRRTKFQLQVVEPLDDIIKKQETSFEQLCDALDLRYFTEAAIESKTVCRSVYQSDRDRLATFVVAEKVAYDAWMDFLPAIPNSYQALCEAIQKMQAFSYNRKNREDYLDRINSYAKLVNALRTPGNGNSAIIETIQQQWGERLEDAIKAENQELKERYTDSLTYLKILTDPTQEPAEQDRCYSLLAKYLRKEIMIYFEEVNKIDAMFGRTSDTPLIEATTFTDFIFADPGASLDRVSFSTFITELKNDKITKSSLDIMLQELKLKRKMIFASIDNEDQQSVESRKNYIEVVGALGYLYHFLPDYDSRLARRAIENKDDKDLLLHKATVDKFIDQYLAYLDACKKQQENTRLFSEQEESEFNQAVDKLYLEVLDEAEKQLTIQTRPTASAA